MAYFKKLQQNKQKRIKNYCQRPNFVHYDPVLHDPAITKEAVASNIREAGRQVVKERFIEREHAKSEYAVKRTVELLADTARKIEKTTGSLQAHDDVKDAIAKWKGRSTKDGFSLPEIVLSGPHIQRSRLRTWTWPRPMRKDNRERQKSVDINMNTAPSRTSISTKNSEFNRKKQKSYENVVLPTVTRKPRAATFTVGSLDTSSYEVARRLSLPIKTANRPCSDSANILDILATQKFIEETKRRSASIGAFEDFMSTKKDHGKLRISRSNSTSSNSLASIDEQAFGRSKLLSLDSQSRSRNSSLSLPDSKVSFDSDDSWPMEDSVFKESEQ